GDASNLVLSVAWAPLVGDGSRHGVGSLARSVAVALLASGRWRWSRPRSPRAGTFLDDLRRASPHRLRRSGGLAEVDQPRVVQPRLRLAAPPAQGLLCDPMGVRQCVALRQRGELELE